VGSVREEASTRGSASAKRTKAEFALSPEVKCDFLKSSCFVVAVLIWPNRAVIRINMHQEATRSPTWPLGGGNRIKVKKSIIKLPNIYEKYFYLSIFLNSNKNF
jgi:hypothetical protein